MMGAKPTFRKVSLKVARKAAKAATAKMAAGLREPASPATLAPGASQAPVSLDGRVAVSAAMHVLSFRSAGGVIAAREKRSTANTPR